MYLSDYGIDFEGGLFDFVETSDEETTESTIVPTSGKLISFTAGSENPHRVNIVRGGERFVLSFWFTCDEKRGFGNFLDGSAHAHFGEKKGEGEL